MDGVIESEQFSKVEISKRNQNCLKKKKINNISRLGSVPLAELTCDP
jgi:DNA-directed RNA polymerase alpha subunit